MAEVLADSKSPLVYVPPADDAATCVFDVVAARLRQVPVRIAAAIALGANAALTAEVEWTFPLEFVEVVFGDGVTTTTAATTTTTG